MDPGPTYVLIVGMCILGVVITFALFLNSENQMLPIFIAAISTLCGYAYGYQAGVKAGVKQANGEATS